MLKLYSYRLNLLFMKLTKSHSVQNYVEEKLIPTWNWMVSIMDSTEAQLRYGSALASAGDPGHPNHPLHASQNSARRERMTAREEASLRTLEGRRYENSLIAGCGMSSLFTVKSLHSQTFKDLLW